MDNIIECPQCKASESGCDYCEHTGYVFSEGGVNYTIKLSSSNKPIKGNLITRKYNSGGTGLLSNIFSPKDEPHDLLWFFKDRKKQ